MRIILNGEPTEVSAPTLSAALAELGYEGEVATAVNEAFVPMTARDTTTLSEGDRVEVLAPRQGG
jgi:sulfur carrier protein